MLDYSNFFLILCALLILQSTSAVTTLWSVLSIGAITSASFWTSNSFVSIKSNLTSWCNQVLSYMIERNCDMGGFLSRIEWKRGWWILRVMSQNKMIISRVGWGWLKELGSQFQQFSASVYFDVKPACTAIWCNRVWIMQWLQCSFWCD